MKTDRMGLSSEVAGTAVHSNAHHYHQHHHTNSTDRNKLKINSKVNMSKEANEEMEACLLLLVQRIQREYGCTVVRLNADFIHDTTVHNKIWLVCTNHCTIVTERSTGRESSRSPESFKLLRTSLVADLGDDNSVQSNNNNNRNRSPDIRNINNNSNILLQSDGYVRSHDYEVTNNNNSNTYIGHNSDQRVADRNARFRPPSNETVQHIIQETYEFSKPTFATSPERGKKRNKSTVRATSPNTINNNSIVGSSSIGGDLGELSSSIIENNKSDDELNMINSSNRASSSRSKLVKRVRVTDISISSNDYNDNNSTATHQPHRHAVPLSTIDDAEMLYKSQHYHTLQIPNARLGVEVPMTASTSVFGSSQLNNNICKGDFCDFDISFLESYEIKFDKYANQQHKHLSDFRKKLMKNDVNVETAAIITSTEHVNNSNSMSHDDGMTRFMGTLMKAGGDNSNNSNTIGGGGLTNSFSFNNSNNNSNSGVSNKPLARSWNPTNSNVANDDASMNSNERRLKLHTHHNHHSHNNNNNSSTAAAATGGAAVGVTNSVSYKIAYRSIIQARQEMPLVKLQLRRHKHGETGDYVSEDSYIDIAVASHLPAVYYTDVPCCANCFKVYNIVNDARAKAMLKIAHRRDMKQQQLQQSNNSIAANNSIITSNTPVSNPIINNSNISMLSNNNLFNSSTKSLNNSYNSFYGVNPDKSSEFIMDNIFELNNESIKSNVTNNDNSFAANSNNDNALFSKRSNAASNTFNSNQSNSNKNLANEHLLSAMEAIRSVTKLDVAEVRTMINPPVPIIIVLEAVMVLLTGKVLSFSETRRLLGGGGESFLLLLREFKLEAVTDSRLKMIQPYVDNPIFRYENIVPVSKCAAKFCSWVLGVVQAARWRRGIGHKRINLVSNNNNSTSVDDTTTPASAAAAIPSDSSSKDEKELTFVQKLERRRKNNERNEQKFPSIHRNNEAQLKSPIKLAHNTSSVNKNNSVASVAGNSLSAESVLSARTFESNTNKMEAPCTNAVPQSLLVESRHKRAITAAQRKSTNRLASLNKTEGNLGLLGAAKSFRCSDGVTLMPYVVLGNTSVEVKRVNFIMIHDFFDNCDSTVILMKPIVKRHNGCQVLCFNYPGQANTVWPRLSNAEKEYMNARNNKNISSNAMTNEVILNNDWLADRLHELLLHAENEGDLLLNNPFYIVGMGNGLSIGAAFIQRYGNSLVYSGSIKGLVSINGFLSPDPQLTSILHSAVQVFESTPHNRPDIPLSYWARYVFSEDYLAKINPNLALNIYTAVSNPITNDGRAMITKGALAHRNLSHNFAPDDTPQLSRIDSNAANNIIQLSAVQVPIIIVQSTENLLVNPSNVDSFLVGRNTKHLWSHQLNYISESALYNNNSIASNNNCNNNAVWVGKLSNGPDNYMKYNILGHNGVKMMLDTLNNSRSAFVVWTRAGHCLQQENKTILYDLFDCLACPTGDYTGYYGNTVNNNNKSSIASVTGSVADNTVASKSSSRLNYNNTANDSVLDVISNLNSEVQEASAKMEVLFKLVPPKSIVRKGKTTVESTEESSEETAVDKSSNDNNNDDSNIEVENVNSNDGELESKEEAEDLAEIRNVIDFNEENASEEVLNVVKPTEADNDADDDVITEHHFKGPLKRTQLSSMKLMKTLSYLSQEAINASNNDKDADNVEADSTTQDESIANNNDNSNNNSDNIGIENNNSNAPAEADYRDDNVNATDVNNVADNVVQHRVDADSEVNRLPALPPPSTIDDNAKDYIASKQQRSDKAWIENDKIPSASAALALEVELAKRQQEYIKLENKLALQRQQEASERLLRLEKDQELRRKQYEEEDKLLLKKLEEELENRRKEREFAERQRRLQMQEIEKNLISSGVLPASVTSQQQPPQQEPILEMPPMNYDYPNDLPASLTQDTNNLVGQLDRMLLDEEDARKKGIMSMETYETVKRQVALRQMERDQKIRHLAVDEQNELFAACTATVQRVGRGYNGRKRAKIAKQQKQLREMLKFGIIRLQAIVRGFLARRRVKLMKRMYMLSLLKANAVVSIQSLYRGHVARKFTRKLRRQVNARHIQRSFRGHLGRSAVRREKCRLNLLKRKQNAAATIQSSWRMKVAKEEFRSLRIHMLAALELQRCYRGYLSRKQTKRRRKWEATPAGPERIKLGLELIEESKVAFERQQEEMDALHRAQERAESRVSHIHAELKESEKELLVLERELQEIDQIERELQTLTHEKELLSSNIKDAVGMPRTASSNTPSHLLLGHESTLLNEADNDRRRKAEAYALEMTIQIKRAEREKKRHELETEFAAVFQEIEKKKKALERLEVALADMESTRERKDREFRRLQANLMQLLLEQKQELDELREKGIELETATATTAAAATATALRAKEHEKRSTAMFSQTEELMKFQFMSMSLSYFSSLNMLKQLRDMNADTTSAAISSSAEAAATAAAASAAANLPNIRKLDLNMPDFANMSIQKKKEELQVSETAEKELRKVRLNPLPDNVRLWSVGDVSKWLETLSLSQYIVAFRDASVDGPFLLELREEDLVQVLGIKHKLHVRKVLVSREKLKPLSEQEKALKESVEREEQADENRRDMGMPDVDTVFSQARNGRIKRVEESLNLGFPIDSEDERGNTLLLVAAQNSNKRLVEMLLVRGANINHQNATGNTALHFALSFDAEGVLGEYLIEHGADDSIENIDGLTPYDGVSA